MNRYFLTKQHSVEAFQWGIDETPHWFLDACLKHAMSNQMHEPVFDHNDNCNGLVNTGDFIYIDVNENIIVSSEESFLKEYEEEK